MFDDILVTGELLPIREAASKGDLDAMLILTDHVLEGKNTKACGETAFRIIVAMFKHNELKKNPRRCWEIFVQAANAEQLLYWQGKASYHDSIKGSCHFLQRLIEAQVSTPRHLWNYRQMESCLAWIRENEPKLQDKEKN